MDRSKNHGVCLGTMVNDNWPIGLLPDGTLPIVEDGCARLPSRAREAARPPNLTDEDFKAILTVVIAEKARLQVEAWFSSARRSV
jgi:hypothetical protein